ncbi:MAG: hypothetical protein IIW40_03080, partial [Clostridia bacterium]|nr:hypothetical protein [Clostridia bacterium]
MNKKAKWIWLGEEKEINAYVDFLCPFTVDTLEAPVELRISAHSHYVAYVNGVHLPISQYGDYAEYKIFDTLDIRPWLHEGENVLAVVGYWQGEDSLCCRMEQAGLWFAVESGDKCLAASDEKVLCRRSVDYVSGEMERISIQLSFSFHYDARRADGWTMPDYKADASWSAATVLPLDYKLFPRPIKELSFEPCRPARIIAQGVFADQAKNDPCGGRVQRAFLSARFPQELGAPAKDLYVPTEKGYTFASDEGDGVYFLVDLGGEEAGPLHLDLDLPRDAMVLVGFGEH